MKKNILFFDTETTGLPLDYNAPVTALDNWPRLVQLAYKVYTWSGTEEYHFSGIIAPVGFIIPDGMVHGISHERAFQEGLQLAAVLKAFRVMLHDCDFVVAHNCDFDVNVLGAEFIRSRMPFPFMDKQTICTQKDFTNQVGIPAKEGARGYGPYKWPSLAELHNYCFGKGVENAHDALADVNATAACFFELRRLHPEAFDQYEI